MRRRLAVAYREPSLDGLVLGQHLHDIPDVLVAKIGIAFRREAIPFFALFAQERLSVERLSASRSAFSNREKRSMLRWTKKS